MLTGFHGVHVTVGIVMLLSLCVLSLRGQLAAEQAETVEIVGLYWHFVDIVWIVIFTVVYLIPAEDGAMSTRTLDHAETFPTTTTSTHESPPRRHRRRQYIKIALILAVLTALEVRTYFVDFGPLVPAGAAHADGRQVPHRRRATSCTSSSTPPILRKAFYARSHPRVSPCIWSR